LPVFGELKIFNIQGGPKSKLHRIISKSKILSQSWA